MRIRTGSATGKLLALLIAFVGFPMSASAQPQPERYVFYLTGTPSKDLSNLCVGDVVMIDVAANRFLANRYAADTNQFTNPPAQVFGVTIDGAVGNPDVGGLFFTRQVTTPRGTPPGSARFKFTATKAGSTSIIFKGSRIATGWFDQFANGNRDYLSTELEVTVKNCEYKVYATTHWHLLGLDYSALVSDIRLKSTGGNRYSGSGTWQFIVTDNPARDPCGPHTKIFEQQVTVTGELDGDELIVDIDYEHPNGEWLIYLTFECTVTSRARLTQFPEALTFKIPASGTSVTLFQTLRDITGLPVYEDPDKPVRVTVVPVAPQ